MFEVLEHLPNPLEVMCHVARLLRPGGLLALSTPNIETLVFKYVGREHYQYFPMEHLYYYSPRTVKRLLNAGGFDMVELRTKNDDTDLLFRKVVSELGICCSLGKGAGGCDSFAFRVTRALFHRLFRKVVRRVIAPMSNSGRQILLFARKR